MNNQERHLVAIKKYIGKRYGRLTVISFDKQIGGNNYFLCACTCGNKKSIQLSALKTGATTSCGCKLIERNTKHGPAHTRLYKVFRDMKTRCYNKNSPDYKNYGAKGVAICDMWLKDFTSFYKWAYANGYDENAKKMKCTIDRIDNYKGYSPKNCRWVDVATQNRNKRKRSKAWYAIGAETK